MKKGANRRRATTRVAPTTGLSGLIFRGMKIGRLQTFCGGWTFHQVGTATSPIAELRGRRLRSIIVRLELGGEGFMARDYAALAVGDVISDRTFPLGLEGVAKYVAAVRDESGVFGPGGRAADTPADGSRDVRSARGAGRPRNTGGDASRGAGDGVSRRGGDGRGV